MCKFMFKLSTVFVCFISFSNAVNKIDCGYKQCPQTREGALNVHIIPHSHMDAGWVKTFDEYYFGTRTSVSSANVQLIYHSVLSELLHDKRRRFTFSETSYFWRWWKEQRPTTRATFRTLVQEGRIDFAGGSWVQNDEATTDYLHIIDQYTWGLRKLNDTLGPCGKPKAAWQIDSYGHSREQASLLAQMGYDGLFIGRIDHRERDVMIEEDRMEFIWRGSDVLGKMSDIMTHTLFNLYNAPDGFCFDFLCNDEPIVDDPDNRVYNADKRVSDFVSQIERQAKYYDHDNILVTMGGDFTYQSAANWFINMDKLINHINTHPANISDINIFYSTPSCYLKSVYLFGKRDKALYTEKGDHFPYGSDSTTYWTGFYTSRPSLKYLIKRAHIFLQVLKQLAVLSGMGDFYELHLLRHAVSLVLHHDAITGTCQQHVANDFTLTLHDAVETCSKKVSQILSYLTPTWGGSRRTKNHQQFIVCHQLNISQCHFAETQEGMLLLVYNPLSVKTYHYVRLPARALHYSIRDYNDEDVEYQLVPNPTAIINLPGRSSTSIQELYFEAENIPALGFAAYYISTIRDQLEENEYSKKISSGINEAQQEVTAYISNEYLKVNVDKNTGLLSSITHVDGLKIDVSQNFYFYSQSQQPLQSGAYSFRPEKQRPTPVTEQATYNSVRGNLVREIRQRFADWITQTLRLYRGEEFLEVEWIIGPVPVSTDLGREVVSIFKTNISNNGEFSTDSNSRQMMKRTCKNGTHNHHQQQKSVSSCYYPISSRICVSSSNTSVEMCVLTDRAQGGTSFNEGEIELMVHRRLLTDDGFGLEEAINEEAHGVPLVVKGKHRIFFGNSNQEVDGLTFSERVAQAARRWQLEPWYFFTSGDKINRRKWQNIRNKRYSALRLHGLPRHIHILTLEPWKGGSVLLRLENTLEEPNRGPFRANKMEGPEDYAAKVSHITVDIRQVFLQMPIRRIRETTLAANQWLDDARQMDWSTRYVYSGSDDGILPDDVVDDTEDKPIQLPETREQGSYLNSNEEVISKQNRQSRQGKNKYKTKRVYREYDREKRSVKETGNIIEKTIHKTANDHNKPENATTSKNLTLAHTEINADVVINSDNKSANIEYTPLDINKKLRKGFSNNERLGKYFNKQIMEVNASEEELTVQDIQLKGDKRKLTVANEEKQSESIDEEITKSMYEMYYKTNPRTKTFKPLLRLPEEYYLKSKRRRNNAKGYRIRSDEFDEVEVAKGRERNRNKRRGRGMTADMPFFMTERKYKNKSRISERYRKKMEKINSDEDGQTYVIPSKSIHKTMEKKNEAYDQETELNEDDEDEDYDEESESETENSRKKRTLPKQNINPEPHSDEEADSPEPQFVVTLRPTQIRTFVVWFETKKKSYVL